MKEEYKDPEERAVAITQLIGIERKTWLQIAGFDKIYAMTLANYFRRSLVKMVMFLEPAFLTTGFFMATV